MENAVRVSISPPLEEKPRKTEMRGHPNEELRLEATRTKGGWLRKALELPNSPSSKGGGVVYSS